ILLGIFDKRTNAAGAVSGMLVGLAFTMGYILYFKGIFMTPMAANVPANWFLGISPEGIGSVGMLLNFAVAIVVSRLTAPPPQHVMYMVDSIRVPRGAGAAPHIAMH